MRSRIIAAEITEQRMMGNINHPPDFTISSMKVSGLVRRAPL
jgi:hypothetical protein